MSQGFFPNITLPTRVTNTTATLIDQIYSKTYDTSQNSYSGILVSKISDHFPIFIFQKCQPNFKKQPERILIRKTGPRQIENFKTELNNYDWSNLYLDQSSNNVENSFDKFFDVIHNIHEKCMPTISVRNKKHKYARSDWITSGLIQSIKHRDKLYSRLKKMNLSNPLYNTRSNELKIYNQNLRKCLNSAKKSFYCSEFNKYKCDMKKTWNVINSILGRKKKKSTFPNKMKTENGSVFIAKQNIANEFNKIFTDNSDTTEVENATSNNNQFSNYLPNYFTSRFCFRQISHNLLDNIVKELSPKHSSGYDNISPYLFKNIFTHIKQPLLFLINLSLQYGIFPNKLKLAKVVPIYKKNEHDKMCNYRPISLLPTVSKIFEKVVFNQMFDYISANNILFESQHGFRKNHSTETAAIEFIENLKSEISKKHTPVSIFLDLSRAFDTVDHNILLQKLNFYGFRGVELNWFKSYLSNRSQFVIWDDNKSNIMNCTKGVPQGSILGPLLFLIYVNDLNFASDIFKLVCYADDSTLTISLCLHLNQPRTNHNWCHTSNYENLINTELEKVIVWLEANNLSLNVSKTKFMIFHNRQFNIEDKIPNLKIRNIPILRVKEFSFLGIVINEFLNWNAHIKHLSKKISQTLGIMYKIKKFVPGACLKHIYQSLIHSHLNYGILLWGFENEKLKILQKKAVRILSQSHYLAHTEPLFKKEKILKIEDIFKLHSYKLYYNFMNNNLPFSIQRLFQINWNSINFRLTLFNCADSAGKKRIRYQLPQMINNSDDSLLHHVLITSLASYKFFVKKHFLDSYDDSPCTTSNCYACNYRPTNNT